MGLHALVVCLAVGTAWAQYGQPAQFGGTKPNDKCEIEIFTRGSCVVNNHQVKPQVVLAFEHKNKGWQAPNYTANNHRQGETLMTLIELSIRTNDI